MNTSQLRTAYIAGPLKAPDQTRWLRAALNAAERAFADGFAPFVPHLTMFWDTVHPHSEDDWMSWCLAYVRVSERVYRVPGPSRGADIETELAESLGIEVVYLTTADVDYA